MGGTSIRRRLLISLISTILILWLIAAFFVYEDATHEVEEIYDATLAQGSRILATLMAHEIEEDKEVEKKLQLLVDELGGGIVNQSELLRSLLQKYSSSQEGKDYLTLIPRDLMNGHRYEANIAFLIKGTNGRTYLRSNLPSEFNEFKEGYHNVTIANRAWRMFGVKQVNGAFNVQVGELLALRQETVSEIVFNSLWPIMILLPMMGLLIWLMVGGGLKPLKIIARNVENREPNALDPIAVDNVPVEVAPMVESLNRLFHRVQSTLENERRFTADAAHELRTPLAALKTLAQAKSLGGNLEHKDFLDQIIRGVDRLTHLLEQLLTLARMDSQAVGDTHVQSVDIQRETINILSTIASSALEKDIEISYDGPEDPVYVPGYSPAIQILLRNIIDNAIRYTPECGEVSVRLERQGDQVLLEVIDTGPGVPEGQQQGLYQRFRRGEAAQAPGSGLGLAIVKRIVDLHRAVIRMQNRTDRSGLKMSVLFPADR
jgi:two-component system, OmpR family, sensor histidine kinase QseC